MVSPLKFPGRTVRIGARSISPRGGRHGRRAPSTSFPDVTGQEAGREVVIETRGLAKTFGEREALREVSFVAHRGELLAVIGPNGAGKTTLLSILAGIRRPDGGSVSRPPGEIGWVPQQAALYRRLTVAENLRLFARLEKVPDPERVVDEMLAQTALADRRDDQAGTLSGGNQQRINIAIGLLARPAVLLLDEPSAGLDPRQRERLWDFVLALAGGGTTVVFSTHDLAEAERYGRRLLVLADGENVFDGTPPELHAAVPESGARDFEQAFVAFLRERGH
jgi:ABC-2 type transport system ATP-binding protein